jgi:hypothetical protein
VFDHLADLRFGAVKTVLRDTLFVTVDVAQMGSARRLIKRHRKLGVAGSSASPRT